MFKLFNDMIRGDLRPHLIQEHNMNLLESLLKEEDYTELNNEKILKTSFEFLDRRKYLTSQKRELCGVFREDDQDDARYLKIASVENDNDADPIDLPNIPDLKAEIFLSLVKNEVELIKNNVDQFILNVNNIESSKFFAKKNIYLLKELAIDLMFYHTELGPNGDDYFDPDSNHFVYYLLKKYIIELIQCFQCTFSHFFDLRVQRILELENELFLVPYLRMPESDIFALLPKKKEFENFINEYEKSEAMSGEASDYVSFMKSRSVGNDLFLFYRSKFKKIKTTSNKITKYGEVLHFWNELLISNKLKTKISGALENEPEIEKILIPLLENEIKFLEKEVEKEKIKNNKSVESIANSITLKSSDLLTVNDFFALLVSEELSSLDVENYIQKLTDNFNIKKLKQLLYDVQCCFSMEKDERESEISDEEFQEAFKRFHDAGKEIPKIIFPPLKDKEGKIIFEGRETLDVQKLIYPYEYYSVYAAMAKIKNLIEGNGNIPSMDEKVIDKIISSDKYINSVKQSEPKKFNNEQDSSISLEVELIPVSDVNDQKKDADKKVEEKIKLKAVINDYIREEFQNLHRNKHWEYAFINEEDRNKVINILSDYFIGYNSTLPSEIRLRIGCKTKLAKVLRVIHDRYSENKLKGDEKFYDIIRQLSHFKSEDNNGIYKLMIS